MEADTDSLRSAAPRWSLAGDQQLLGVLQTMHERLVSRCQGTERRLGDMAAALDHASLHLQNVNNRFMALSNSQFIESRVYEDDADIASPPQPDKEPPPAPVSELEQMKQGLQVLEDMHEPLTIMDTDSDTESDEEVSRDKGEMKKGLKVLEDMHEPLTIMDTDSDTESEEEVSRVVLKPKDLYEDRPLPYIIGSYDWQSKWHAGLVAEDSDSDSSGPPWERHEYSESEPELSKPSEEQGSSSGSELEQAAAAEPISPAAIAAELSRRLRAQEPEPPPQPQPQSAPPPVTKVYRPEQPATSNIFSDEPPPLDQTYQSDEDDGDIFAELRRNQPYSQSSRVQSNITNDLFGAKDNDDVFSDFREPPPPPIHQKSTLFSEESEPELFAEQPPPLPKETQSADSNIKKPVGGISLFGNQGTESIGAAILKRNRRQSSTDEDVSEDTSHKQEKDIFDHLFAKSKKEQRKNKNKVDVEPVRETKVDKKVDLFSDNLFDDIDDIFTSNIPKVPIKTADKNQKSLFDDEDDLFTDISAAKSSVKETKNKSIFDSQDDLFADNIEKNVQSKSTEKSNSDIIAIDKETSLKSDNKKSIFDSDDDLFTDNLLASKKTTETKPDKNLVTHEPDIKSKTKIILHDSDIFAETEPKDLSINKSVDDSYKVATGNKNKKDKDMFDNIEKETPVPVLNTKIASIFDDDEEENIFKTEGVIKEVKDKSYEINNSVNIEPNSLVDTDSSKKQNVKSMFDDKFESHVQNNDKGLNTVKKMIDGQKSKTLLFNDDSEDELFSDKPKQVTTKNVDKKITEAKSHNIFDDDDDEIFRDTSSTKSLHFSPKEQMLDEKYNKNSLEETRKEKNVEVIKDDKSEQSLKPTNSYTEPSEPVKGSIFDDDDDDIIKKTLSKDKVGNSDITDVRKKSLLFDELQNELFTNTQTTINKEDYIAEDQKIPEEIEGTNEKPISDLLKTKSEIEVRDSGPNNETPAAINKAVDPAFSKPDAFADIFVEPPEFEKPKEPKKSKNVNALFDDDSDDESLFFKKNDPTLDERPEFVSPTTENRLFGIFQDEPPALEVDFVQKSNVKIKNDRVTSILHETNAIVDDEKVKITKRDDSSTSNDQVDFDFLPKAVEIKPLENDDKITYTNDKPIAKDDLENIEKAPKPIGKLKTMNFNINVNALLPGASRKKDKTIEQVDGNTQTKSSEDIRIKSTQETDSKMVKSISFEGKPESQVLDNTLSKERARIQVKRRPSTRRARKEAVRKSGIDFGDDSTDNSSSIDDQPKITKQGRGKVAENIVKVNVERLTGSEDESVLSEPTENITNRLHSDEEITTTENVKNTNKFTEININTIDIDKELFEDKTEDTSKHDENSLNEKQINAEVFASHDSLFSQKPEVTTKTVYILNDEDIFSVEKPKKVLNIVDDDIPGVSTLGKAYSESKNPRNSDSEDDLFKGVNTKINKKIESTNSDEKLFKPQMKSEPTTKVTDDTLFQTPATIKKDDKLEKKEIFSDDKKSNDVDEDLFKPQIEKKADKKSIFDLSDDEDLFSNNQRKDKPVDEVFKKEVKKVDVKASLFGDDDDLFSSGSSKKIVDFSSPSSSLQPSRVKELLTKPSEPVFEDPLSLLGSDDD